MRGSVLGVVALRDLDTIEMFAIDYTEYDIFSNVQERTSLCMACQGPCGNLGGDGDEVVEVKRGMEKMGRAVT
jgi:hypothetical protein